MKTTLDLPDDLVRTVKVRAAQSNRRLKDVVAELLEKGLRTPPTQPRQKFDTPRADQPEISKETGLPLICGPEDAPIASMSTEAVYQLIRQTQAEEDSERLSRGFSSV